MKLKYSWESQAEAETIWQAKESIPIPEEDPSHISNEEDAWQQAGNQSHVDEIEAELKEAREERENNERMIMLRKKLPSLFGEEENEPEVTTILKPTNDTEIFDLGPSSKNN